MFCIPPDTQKDRVRNSGLSATLDQRSLSSQHSAKIHLFNFHKKGYISELTQEKISKAHM